MSLPDKHDARLFRHYAKFDIDGHFLGLVEYVAQNAIPPSDARYVDVTALAPHDYTGSTEAALQQAVDVLARG